MIWVVRICATIVLFMILIQAVFKDDKMDLRNEGQFIQSLYALVISCIIVVSWWISLKVIK
jgi:hypothetical protein